MASWILTCPEETSLMTSRLSVAFLVLSTHYLAWLRIVVVRNQPELPGVEVLLPQASMTRELIPRHPNSFVEDFLRNLPAVEVHDPHPLEVRTFPTPPL